MLENVDVESVGDEGGEFMGISLISGGSGE